jgi:hypothetical protein
MIVSLLVFCGVSFFEVCLAMDAPHDNAVAKGMIRLQLSADNTEYDIADWKVRHESNTLCKFYYYQGMKNTISVPHITLPEIELFDEALDKGVGDARFC